MRTLMASLLVLILTSPASAQTLDIYFIDVEGGQATLYVAPSGESMLVDTGWPGDRDPDRIVDVLRTAGLDRIDHLVLSHYHVDHFGGLEGLVSRIPVARFYDHGSSPESDRPPIQAYERTYAAIHARGERTIVRPGDRIPLAGVDVLVVASHDEYLPSPIPGAPGAGIGNPACTSFREREQPEPDPDNDYSVGLVVSYGTFRTINLGDLTWNREPRLMCPDNLVGTVDLYVTSHHGVDRSGSEVLVHALRPRVAVMNNGTRKGGSVSALEIMHTSPGLEDIWQLHWSHHGGLEYNAPGILIANVDAPAVIARVIDPSDQPIRPAGGGQDHPRVHHLKVSALENGSFTITNSRNGFVKAYEVAEEAR